MIALIHGLAVHRLSQIGRLLLDVALSRRVIVRGDSMAPTLSDGDRVLVNRAAYRLVSPARGDVVLLGTSVAGIETVKRIVAGPGDPFPDVEANDPSAARGAPAARLATDEYYVLGDNSAISRDSRVFGPASRREIVGRVWYRYSPAGRTGRIGNNQGGARGQPKL